MSDSSQGPGWWQASDGKWYPPGPGSPPPPTPPPGYVPPGMGAPYGAAPRTNSNAVISLVLGIAGLLLCGIFTGIPAVIVGGKAKKDIAASGGAEGGGGMATAGVVLGWIATAWTVLMVGLVIVVVLLGEPASDTFVPVDNGGINSDPADGTCDFDRFLEDPDC